MPAPDTYAVRVATPSGQLAAYHLNSAQMADNLVVSSSELLGRLLPMIRLSALRSYGSDAKVSGRYVSSPSVRLLRCTTVGRRQRSRAEAGGIK